MTNEEILQKAIEKAVKNGYRYSDDEIDISQWLMDSLQPFSIIYSQDFAKAFFGEEDEWNNTKCTCGGMGVHPLQDWHSNDCLKVKCNRGYRFHLQKMVISEDPIKYLESYL